MKNSKYYVEMRRASIVKLLKRNSLTVAELADELGVSPATIRRDLTELVRRSQVLWGDGRASVLSPTSVEESHRQKINIAIARRAADMIKSNINLFINTSSTALQTIPYINVPNVSVITNSGKVQNIDIPPNVQVYVTGGEFTPPKGIMSGGTTLEMSNKYSADFCILGCAGLTPNNGLTSNTIKEAEVNSLMFNRSRRRIILAGSNKIGHRTGFSFGSINKIDVLITDSGISGEEIDALCLAGIGRVIVVDPNPSDVGEKTGDVSTLL